MRTLSPATHQPALRALRARGRGAAGRAAGRDVRPTRRSRRTGRCPTGAEAQARLCFANCAAILAEAGMGPARRDPHQRLCHRPRPYGGLHGRARCLAGRRRAAACLDTGDRVGLHPARVPGRGRGDGGGALIARHLEIPASAMAALDPDRPFPVGHGRVHPGVGVQRGTVTSTPRAGSSTRQRTGTRRSATSASSSGVSVTRAGRQRVGRAIGGDPGADRVARARVAQPVDHQPRPVVEHQREPVPPRLVLRPAAARTIPGRARPAR